MHEESINQGSENLLQLNMEPEFWTRQFQQEATQKQRRYDWTFGVILPLLCFAFDPFLFRTMSLGGAIYGTIRPFVYLLSAVAIMAMAAWLLWGDRLKWLTAPLAGLFLISGILSIGVGLLLFPYSMVGLIVLIGALGFTPFVTGIIFLRNGVRAYRSGVAILGDDFGWRVTLLAAVFSFVIPYVVNFEIYNATHTMLRGDVDVIRYESAKLRLVAPLIDPAPIRTYYRTRRYLEGSDVKRFEEIANAYLRLTGEELQ